MLHIILYQPQIPQNTGNIGRMCAITRSRLHLIHPLGFKISDYHLKRSGMDYWYDLDVIHHESWNDFICSKDCPERIWLFTTKSQNPYWNALFEDHDGLLFGNETSGAGFEVHTWLTHNYKLTIPHFNPHLRSLNLSTAAGIATYEALRQIHKTH
jgi:tRNA (cytidine/uridine-2'-O-)-methyltransferase